MNDPVEHETFVEEGLNDASWQCTCGAGMEHVSTRAVAARAASDHERDARRSR